MYGQLKQYFLDKTGASEATRQHIAGFFRPLCTRRNEFLLHQGDTCKHYYFVNQGCLRIFTVSAAGEEATRYFAFEGAFGTALPSLIEQTPAFECIQTIEKSELLAITRDDFFHLVDTVPEVAAAYRKILEAAFITAQKRIYGFQTLTALDKLKWLLDYQPKILSRVSNKMAASFLGITPYTLSRLKAQL